MASSSNLSTFASHGWVHVRNFLSPSELELLQHESYACYNSVPDANEAAAAVAAQGCVIDIMASSPIRDDDPARIDAKFYLKARAKQVEKSVGCQPFDDQKVFSELMFERLPTLVGQLLATESNSTEAVGVMFFNEHYVVKPPRSHVEFRWHRDEDEQLAMCLHRETILPYVSAWCALDDVTSENGALQFVSLAASGARNGDADFDQHATEPILANAGDVLLFLSNVWHCSSSNESSYPRRAFYAQYSREKITAGPKDPSPLSFAIPCRPVFSTSSGGNNRGTKKLRSNALDQGSSDTKV
ncbi:hypothetical protein PHYBOEH_006370 [Phytophthora boehmeriae]|uniref:Phytanoyl-CoA dioxygenase n=1 Tax=Phytophthora boehmeriae TaxID=109152 RepID=A0A8T1WGW4_9STRA|nr:hypothetical protein PHYBOEH_006370 [Phytophthora boehmeriae]